MAEAHKKRPHREPSVGYKVCSKCGVDRPVSDYYREPKKNDGLSYACRGCTLIRSTEWAERNQGRRRETDQKKRIRYLADGRDRTYARRWRARHPNHYKEYYRRNFERDRDKLWLRDQRRRARLAGLPWNFSKEDKADVMEMFEHECAFCGSVNELTMEHVVPVDRRDVLNPGTVRGNIIPLCKLCNDSKGTKLLEEYLLNPKMLRPQISEHLQARDATVGDLVTEIRFLLHILK
jgi:5-methylcytosine-specific restriction endonuclease McrA